MREITSRLDLLYPGGPPLRSGTIGAYLVAFVSVGVATALRLAIGPYVEGFQFATFLPAVIITTLISGLGAGLFCVVLSVAAVALFVLPHRLSFYVDEPGDVLALLLYTVVMLANVALVAGMRVAVERTRDQQVLQASKDRLQLALNASVLGWWQYDPLRGEVLGDTRYKEIFDFTADETPTLEEFIKRVHPDDLERVLADRDAALNPADPKPYAHEYRICRRDGEVRWVDSHGLAYFEGTGRERRAVSFIGTIADITQRKESAERERLLIREINHRAKNMLSLVQAIARQTASREPPDFIGRFAERIQALAANQDLLIRNEWHGVDVEDLVRAQLAHFADLVGTRIGAQGPKLRLNAAAAQAIGLAMHELATNAGKYGALSVDKGRVNVYWETDGDTLTMSWTECGGPPVSPPERRGFGIVVMQEMVEHSVDGDVDLDYAPSGLTWRLTCPAASALEHPWSPSSAYISAAILRERLSSLSEKATSYNPSIAIVGSTRAFGGLSAREELYPPLAEEARPVDSLGLQLIVIPENRGAQGPGERSSTLRKGGVGSQINHPAQYLW